MKVSLVVATGAHEGRIIPLTGPQLTIGRDQQCNLRPASPAISKLHCAILIRDGKVYAKDFGSTNGTLVNGKIIQGAEVAIEDGTAIQIGPLDFRLKIEKTTANADGTPLGDSSEATAALAAVRAATAVSVSTPRPSSRDTTPTPARPAAGISGSVHQPAAKASSKPAAPAKPAGSKEAALTTSSETITEDDHDRAAAMMLGMEDDGGEVRVPTDSTIVEMPKLAAEAESSTKPDDKAKPPEKKAQTREEMSDTANDLLRKYMRRPK